MSGDTPHAFSSSGGAGGIEADHEDMHSEAGALDSAGDRLGDITREMQAYLADGDVAASAALDPMGVVRYESAMACALDGWRGLARTAVELELSATYLRTAVWTQQTTDAALAVIARTANGAVNIGIAATAPVWVPVLAVGAGIYVAEEMARGKDPVKDAGRFLGSDGTQRWITDHTGLVNDVVNIVPGILGGVAGLVGGAAVFPPIAGMTGTQLTGLLATLKPDGHYRLSPPDPRAWVRANPDEPATGLQGLLHNLDLVNKRNHSGDAGRITIERLTSTGPDGRPHDSWVVNIPGTTTWDVGPGHNDDVTDFGTNLRSMANERTQYEAGIEAAMTAAGIKKGDPVMLVGHSQGGMVAVQTANDAARTGNFTITHVLTAGSPVGNMHIDPKVDVLSLENRNDVVPTLDGRGNADQWNHTTVSFDMQNGSIGDNHGLTTAYVPAAGSLDTASGGAASAWKASAGQFFNSTHHTTSEVEISRGL